MWMPIWVKNISDLLKEVPPAMWHLNTRRNQQRQLNSRRAATVARAVNAPREHKLTAADSIKRFLVFGMRQPGKPRVHTLGVVIV